MTETNGWPGPDEPAPMHGIVVAAAFGVLGWILAFAFAVLAVHLATGWTP